MNAIRRGGVSVRCPAKLNLFLTVTAKEDTGYHQLETLFQAVELADVLTVGPAEGEGVTLHVRTPGSPSEPVDLGPDEQNTCVRAANAFLAAVGRSCGVAIGLEKNIPAGTGLGGASSDAAGVLLALNALLGEPLRMSELIALGGEIGADVPFFLARHPFAIAWGRGDRLLALPPLPVAEVVLVIPEVRVSTVEAYAGLSSVLDLPVPSGAMEQRALSSWEEVGWLQRNDFEGPTFAAEPILATYVEVLGDAGALVARMTGSGSAVFGVFPNGGRADAAADRLVAMDGVQSVLRTRTIASHPLNPVGAVR